MSTTVRAKEPLVISAPDTDFQSDSPGKDKEPNWLPAPKGPFNLTMRLYSPLADALTGKWNPPPIKNL
jgi:hypothetical protein